EPDGTDRSVGSGFTHGAIASGTLVTAFNGRPILKIRASMTVTTGRPPKYGFASFDAYSMHSRNGQVNPLVVVIEPRRHLSRPSGLPTLRRHWSGIGLYNFDGF